MTRKCEKRTVFLIILSVVALAAVIMRCIALFVDFEPKSGYFDGKVLITIANSLVVAGAIFFLSALFVIKKDTKLIASFSTPATYIPTGLLAVAILFLSVNTISNAKITTIKLLFTGLKKPEILFAVLLFIFGILAIFHFILNAIITGRSSVERAALGLCAVGFFSIYAIYLYFSKELPLNAPNKLVDQMAYLFSALFFLYETRISLGREKWNCYIGFGLIASLTTAYSAIPAFIYYLATGVTVTHSIYELALTITLFIFVTSRLILAAGLKRDCESPFISALKKKFASLRISADRTHDERFVYLDSINEEAQAEETSTSEENTAGDAEEDTLPELEIETMTEEDTDAEIEIEISLEPSEDAEEHEEEGGLEPESDFPAAEERDSEEADGAANDTESEDGDCE